MKIYQLAVLGVLAFCLGCSSGESGKSSSGGPSSGEEATATTDVSTGDAGTTGDVEDAKSTGKSDAKSVDMANMTPEKVLESMVAAYKNASSYTDEGQIQLLGIRGPNESKSIPLISPMSMSLEKPNKLQIIANKGTVICDGKNFYGYVDPLPTQVFQKPAPEKITIESVFTEPILADAMAQGPTQYYTWIPIQAILLLADKPLNTLLYNVERSELLKPQTFQGHPCYRVAIYRNDGKGVFWIDAETFVLRRFEYPLGNLLNDLQTDQADDLKVIADFRNAKLNGEIAERTFSFQPPKKSQIVDMLAPLQIHMLGQPAPEFFFERTDDKPPVTLKSLKGKTVVIDFWASWSMQCRGFLSVTSKVAEAFKDNDNVVFLACSTDRGTVENQELEKALKSMNVSIPLVRDTQDFSHREFFIPGVPTTVIIGPKGIVQDYQVQVDPRRYMVLSRAIQAVAQGANIYERQLSMFDELRKNYEKIFQRMLAEDLFIDPQSISQMMPLPGVARQSAPRRARLMQLWKCKDVGIPGNIVVLKDTEPQRILVCHDSHSVAELDARGKIIKNYRFAIPPIDAAITNLRPGKTADGKQFYIGFAPSFQQFFFLDEKFNVKWGFPESLAQGAPSGIADVQVGDLDDDGTPEIYVGYLGKAGVKAISLEGQVLWSNRKTSGVTKMAIIPKTPEKSESIDLHYRSTFAC